MKTRRKVVTKVLDAYKIPSKEVLRHRNEFFGLWRRSDDQTTAWLERVQNCIRHCKFPTNTAEHLLVDRFICGLNVNELKSIQKAKKSWTTKQLLEHFSKENNSIAYIEVTLAPAQSAPQIENISLGVVKSEPTEEECMREDPLNELTEDADSIKDKEQKRSNENEHIRTATDQAEISATNNDTAAMVADSDVSEDIADELEIAKNEPIEEDCFMRDPLNESKEGTDMKLAVDGINDELMEAPEEIASSDDEENNFQQALIEEVDHESLNNGMQFECEDYKFPGDVNFTGVTAADSINDVSIVTSDVPVATNDTIAVDITIDDVGENLSNKCIEDAPDKNNQQKHCSDGNQTPINIDSVTSTTAHKTDNADENPSDISVDDELNRNDQPVKKKKPPRRHTCKECNRSFNRPGKLKVHIKDVHNGIRDHVCKECGKLYVRLYDLQTHYHTHTGGRPYICDKCGVSYAYSTALAKHKKAVHSGLRPHVCRICDKRFTLKTYLTEHLLIHSNEKLFVCEECGKGFNRKSTLRAHKNRVHQQKIPSHACPICKKCFMGAAELKYHSLKHTGERPHSCEQCDKKFSTLMYLKRHKNAIHEGLRPYACPHCDERFKAPHHLKQHLTIHTGVKAYSCDQCDMAFALGHHLSNHKKSVHQQKA